MESQVKCNEIVQIARQVAGHNKAEREHAQKEKSQRRDRELVHGTD